jgi:hypothetical protein
MRKAAADFEVLPAVSMKDLHTVVGIVLQSSGCGSIV